MSWAGVILLWAMYVVVLLAALAREDYGTAWFFASALCVNSALLRRIGSCRLVLHTGFLLVENAISTHRVPYKDIRDVELTSSGGIRIATFQGDEVRPFAFGGSLVDAFFGTSERAVAEIRKRVPGRAQAPRGEQAESGRRLRHCRSADLFLILAAVTAAAGLVTEIL